MQKNILFKWLMLLLVLVLVLASCGGNRGNLPTPNVSVTSAPEAGGTAQLYLSAWEKEDYTSMYALLSSQSAAAHAVEELTDLYKDAAINTTLKSLSTEILSEMTNPHNAIVRYRTDFSTNMFGDFSRDTEMELLLENGSWKVNWENGMIMPELKGGNSLALDLTVPARGSIYDRNGNPIVQQTEAYALGIIPGQIEEGREGQLLYQLSLLTGKPEKTIQALYQDVGADWYVAVGEAPADEVNAKWNTLINLGGVVMTRFVSRYYYNGGVAPQAVGYALGISAEELEEYQRLGYLGDEKVGQAGLEKYAEVELAGKSAASLYVVDANGQIVTRIAQSDPRPTHDITTTLDAELQVAAQQALASFQGAAVVMEVDTGRILAMVSSPSIDPNLFEPTNRNNEILNNILNDGQQRLLNRAAQSSYPLGSVLKIITMAAALESDLYTPDSSYYCDSYFEELPGERFKDWTVDKELPPSGDLTLSQGLMRSCNPWFYHLGLDLFRQKGANFVSDMAKGFGLGSATGIEQVAEDPGSIPVPKTDGESIQLAIGQGGTLVTPLQVARFIAAIGNDGTLYRPQIIETITSSTGVTTYTFEPQADGTIPVSEETMIAIQDAMRLVVKAQRGTAYIPLEGISIPVYGKTGTATTSTDKSHAWFVGYTNTNREDKPDIAIVVIAEFAGEGSEVAAPIFRRILEQYYYGRPGKLYPWESSMNVTRTPTLQYTLTPTVTPYRPPTEEQGTPTPAG